METVRLTLFARDGEPARLSVNGRHMTLSATTPANARAEVETGLTEDGATFTGWRPATCERESVPGIWFTDATIPV